MTATTALLVAAGLSLLAAFGCWILRLIEISDDIRELYEPRRLYTKGGVELIDLSRPRDYVRAGIGFLILAFLLLVLAWCTHLAGL